MTSQDDDDRPFDLWIERLDGNWAKIRTLNTRESADEEAEVLNELGYCTKITQGTRRPLLITHTEGSHEES